MRASVTVVLLTCISLSRCVTIHRIQQPDIISKTRVELKPILISCSLLDIIIIPAPIVHTARYYLYKPNGEVTRLNITKPNYNSTNKPIFNEYDNILVKYTKNFKGILPLKKYKIFNLKTKEFETYDVFQEKTNDFKANEFMIGPLVESDHGNWVLSAYYKDKNGEWAEMFQVITIEIIAYVSSRPHSASLTPGSTFQLSFAYPITGLESCELKAPRSTFDRFYDRNKVDMDYCSYIIKNITQEDEGLWSITAVGRIVYETDVELKVTNSTNIDNNIYII